MVRLNHNFAGNCAAWVALFAMALNALWPLIAQAKPGEAAPLVESCVETGMHHDAAGHEHSAPAEPSQLMPHCAFCSLTGSGFAALAADLNTIVFLGETEEFRIALPDVLPIASFTYSLAHPRAPPVFS